MENEIWKDIKNYEGHYQISSIGRVRNIISGKLKTLFKHICGYEKVTLYNNGKGKKYYIHRLVAEAFIPNPDNLPFVNHKDENKTNNCIDNLEWCTNEYNLNYGTRNNRISKKQINDANKSKVVLQYTLDGMLLYKWPSTHEIERQLGYVSNYIGDCCNGKYKKAYNFIWKYSE